MPNLLQAAEAALHPMLVHFPIALYPTSLVFDALSTWPTTATRSCGAPSP